VPLMPRSRNVRPARQARSRESLAKLLRATGEVLREQGLDGATIPNIAARAGLSAGSVYRRFPDKDHLLREVFVRVFEQSYTASEAWFDPSQWKGKSLTAISQSIFEKTIESYRKNARLLRALLLYIDLHPDAGFRHRAQALQFATYERMVRLILTRRDEIRHPDPEYAVRFGLLLVFTGARELILAHVEKPDVTASMGYSDESAERETVRVFLSYLQVKQK
jgi:AcrR family transcriptional regulator